MVPFTVMLPVLLVVAIASIHEFLHYVVWRIYGYSVRPVIRWWSIGVYVDDEDVRDIKHLVLATYAPQIITVTLIVSALFVSDTYLAIMLVVSGVAHFIASAWDFKELIRYARQYSSRNINLVLL